MKRYEKLEERKLADYKAWYCPDTDKFTQFSTNMLHSENIGMPEEKALEKGYIRVYAHNGIMGIESYNIPNDRVFNSLKYKLIDNTKIPKIKVVIWDTNKNNQFFTFKNVSFFYADSIKK